MFTVTRLKVTGALLRTLSSTNPVESMIEIIRNRSRNVKHWRDGDLRLRRAATGLLAAQQFRRVSGHGQLPALAVRALVPVDTPTGTMDKVSA